jgi:hypothetical protein
MKLTPKVLASRPASRSELPLPFHDQGRVGDPGVNLISGALARRLTGSSADLIDEGD